MFLCHQEMLGGWLNFANDFFFVGGSAGPKGVRWALRVSQAGRPKNLKPISALRKKFGARDCWGDHSCENGGSIQKNGGRLPDFLFGSI